MATVRTFLDLSTAHLPARFFQPSAPSVTGWWTTEYGAFVWVPDDPADAANLGDPDDEDDGDHAAEVIAVRVYARSLGCDYIMFDSDAEIDPALPTFLSSFEDAASSPCEDCDCAPCECPDLDECIDCGGSTAPGTPSPHVCGTPTPEARAAYLLGTLSAYARNGIASHGLAFTTYEETESEDVCRELARQAREWSTANYDADGKWCGGDVTLPGDAE